MVHSLYLQIGKFSKLSLWKRTFEGPDVDHKQLYVFDSLVEAENFASKIHKTVKEMRSQIKVHYDGEDYTLHDLKVMLTEHNTEAEKLKTLIRDIERK